MLTCPEAQQTSSSLTCPRELCKGIPCERKQPKLDVQEASRYTILIMLCNTLQIEVINN